MLRRRPLLRAAATTAVVAGTATAVSGRVRRRQDNRAMESAEAQAYEQQQYAQPQYAPEPQYAPQPQYAPPPQPAPQPAPVSAGIDVEQLTALASLHQQGALTDEEFASAKAKILAG